MRLVRTLVAIACFAPASGCCNLGRYFCGPDRSIWVSERYETPSRAIATFREAVRRADAVVLSRCLSERYKAATGLTGVVEAAMVLERLDQDVPGFHLLGYAEVSDGRPVDSDRIEYSLTVVDREVRVVLIRQAFWEVARVFGDDPDDLEPTGENLESVRSVLTARWDPEQFETSLRLELPPIPAEIPTDTLQSIAAGLEWKVDFLEPIADDA